VEHVARVGQLAPGLVGDDPVELAPARLDLAVRPRHDPDRAVLEDQLHLAGPDLLEGPRHRRALRDGRAALRPGDLVGPELALPESVSRPAGRGECLLPHEVAEDRAGRLAAVRT